MSPVSNILAVFLEEISCNAEFLVPIQNSPYESYELYNLIDDPLEKNNLIEIETAVYKELNSLLMNRIQIGGKIPWQKK